MEEDNIYRGQYLYVGKGWHSIVKPLIDYCLEHKVTIFEIKQKFGMLRFYTGASPVEFWFMVDEAEKKSMITCEECGKPGKRVGEEWVLTLCEEHEVIFSKLYFTRIRRKKHD